MLSANWHLPSADSLAPAPDVLLLHPRTTLSVPKVLITAQVLSLSCKQKRKPRLGETAQKAGSSSRALLAVGKVLATPQQSPGQMPNVFSNIL